MKNTITIDQYKEKYFGREFTKTSGQFKPLTDINRLANIFEQFGSVVVKLEGGYFRWTFCPRVVTKNKDGSDSITRTQTTDTYNKYKRYIFERFKKGQLYEQVD